MTTEQIPVTEMTPVEIDTELSRLWNEEAQAEAYRLSLQVSLHHHVGDEGRRVRGARRPIFSLSWEQVLEKALMKALAPHTAFEAVVAREVNQVLTNWALVSRKLENLAAEIKPYVDEYVRRGRWNRVFLAQSHGGHAHNGQECSTCHNGEQRTQFAWKVQYSGKTEAEIVTDAGWRACTTCYPSAPVGDEKTLPTKMFTPDEETAQKAREERAAQKVTREATQAAKSITNPDGSPLQGRHGRIETEVTAVREAVDELSERYKNLRTEQILTADPGLTPFFYEKDKRAQWEAEARGRALPLIEAIAHKRGATVADVLTELEGKAFAKAKRDSSGRDWVANFKRNATWNLEDRDAYLAACEKEGRTPWEALSLKWPKEF